MNLHESALRYLGRRDLLKTAAGGLASTLIPLSDVWGAATPPERGLIRAENEKPGTFDWLLSNTRVDPATQYRSPWIEGYCSHTSIHAGDKLAIMVSTNPPSPFILDIYRMGYYGGKGGRHMLRLGPFQGSAQPEPEVGEQRIRECRWEPAATLDIPEDWPSGVYLGQLTAEREKLQSYVIFIVRDNRTCDFLFQCSDTTWSAYNRWPHRWSLYDHSKKTTPTEWYLGPEVQVSWDRPYGKYRQVLDAPLSQGSGEFLLWEFPMAFWMEKEGYDVSYISKVDTHADSRGLLRAKGLLCVGHDEYWSLEMFENVQAAVAQGVNVAFLSGDTCSGMVSLFPSTQKVPHRGMSRTGLFGPLDLIDEETQNIFPEVREFNRFGPTEKTLIGARNTYPWVGGADWTCVDDQHWIFAGTGMKNGDSIPGLVGWESMGDPADIPGLQVVATGELLSKKGTYTATIYPGPRDNFVFNAATIWWTDGLGFPPGYQHPSSYGAKPKGPDPRVQRITDNLLTRFRGA